MEGCLRAIPAEVSLLEASLESGVQGVRESNQVVHHGPIPLGMRNDMLRRAERHHRMEVDLDGDNPLRLETDLEKVVTVSN